MATHSLTEPFEAMGEWYLPESGRRVAGTLSYNAHQTMLNLNEALEAIPVGEIIRLGIDDIQTYPVVHGITNGGEAVTILNATQTGSPFSLSSGGVRMPTSLVCGMLILGGYVNAETAYASIECLVPGLEAWFSNHSITGGYRQGRVCFENVAHVKEVATVSVLNAELTLANKFKFTPGAHSASIKTQASFCLKPEGPKELQWYFDQVYKTINLLSLLAGSPMSPSEITLLTDASRPTEGHLSVLTSRLNSTFCDLTREWEFFIPRSILGESYERVIQSWFSLYPQVEAACGLALSVINKNDLWTHLEFLSLMQALEGLHRALNDGTYMSAADYSEVYDALVKAIPTNVSQPHRQALLSKIKYGNEISLRKRLRALEDNLSSPVRKCILGEAARVPQTWIDTRHYYTHWDETLKSSILDIENMHYASVRLRALLRVLYLHFAGVSDDILTAALKNNSRASLALKNAAKPATT